MVTSIQIVTIVASFLGAAVLALPCIVLCKDCAKRRGCIEDPLNSGLRRADEGIVGRGFFGMTTVRAYFASRSRSRSTRVSNSPRSNHQDQVESQIIRISSNLYAERVDSEAEPSARSSKVPVANQIQDRDISL